MKPAELLSALLEATDADQVTIPRAWLEAILAGAELGGRGAIEYVTVEAFAERWKVAPSTARSWCPRIPGAFRRGGGPWQIPADALPPAEGEEPRASAPRQTQHDLGDWRQKRRAS